MNARVRLAAGVLAACLGAGGCTTATPTGRPSAAPSANPTDPGTGGPIAALRVTDEALPAGHYIATGFKPEITIALDGTWQAFNLLDGFFDLGHVSEAEEITLVQFARVDAVFAALDSTKPTPMGPDAAVATLTSNAGLRVVETSESRMSGLVGAQVTVEPAASSDVPLLMASGSPIVVEEGRRQWIAFFDTPDGLLAIMVSGRNDQWDAALAAAEPILESVTIGVSP